MPWSQREPKKRDRRRERTGKTRPMFSKTSRGEEAFFQPSVAMTIIPLFFKGALTGNIDWLSLIMSTIPQSRGSSDRCGARRWRLADAALAPAVDDSVDVDSTQERPGLPGVLPIQLIQSAQRSIHSKPHCSTSAISAAWQAEFVHSLANLQTKLVEADGLGAGNDKTVTRLIACSDPIPPETVFWKCWAVGALLAGGWPRRNPRRTLPLRRERLPKSPTKSLRRSRNLSLAGTRKRGNSRRRRKNRKKERRREGATSDQARTLLRVRVTGPKSVKPRIVHQGKDTRKTTRRGKMPERNGNSMSTTNRRKQKRRSCVASGSAWARTATIPNWREPDCSSAIWTWWWRRTTWETSWRRSSSLTARSSPYPCSSRMDSCSLRPEKSPSERLRASSTL